MRWKTNLLLLAGFFLTACSAVQANDAPESPSITPSKRAPAAVSQTEVPMPAESTPTQARMASQYRDLGLAPELNNSVWINVDHPLKLADQKGKVVLLEMWTFDCINCQHVIPSLLDWDKKYTSQGLVIIGNHFPEFDFERDLGNVKAAVQQWGIHYAVAQDNDGATWNAYHNAYWPTIYLIDKRGHIRYTHIGEGAYSETEAAIQALLAEPAS